MRLLRYAPNDIPLSNPERLRASPTEIELYFDPEHPKVIKSIQIWKGPDIAHELTHAARWQSRKGGNTLLDAIINEGLATYFEEHWEGERKTRWGNSLTQEQEKEEWIKAQPFLSSTDQDRMEWFFGKDGKHPVYTGYSLGTAIVNSYFKKHLFAKMKKVARLDSREILNKSEYLK